MKVCLQWKLFDLLFSFFLNRSDIFWVSSCWCLQHQPVCSLFERLWFNRINMEHVCVKFIDVDCIFMIIIFQCACVCVCVYYKEPLSRSERLQSHAANLDLSSETLRYELMVCLVYLLVKRRETTKQCINIKKVSGTRSPVHNWTIFHQTSWHLIVESCINNSFIEAREHFSQSFDAELLKFILIKSVFIVKAI